mgnify:CR=1 FL=1
MKTIIVTNYTFNKAAQTVTLTDFTTIDLSRILSITDVTNGIQIYSYRINQYGGSISGNVLTLRYNTNNNQFNNSDKLHIEILGDNYSQQIVASAARTSTFTSDPITNYDYKGAVFMVNVSATSGTDTPTLTVKLQMQDIVSSSWMDIPGAVTSGITATGLTALTVYPGLTVSANAKIDFPLPRTYRVVGTITGSTPSFTFSVSVGYIN